MDSLILYYGIMLLIMSSAPKSMLSYNIYMEKLCMEKLCLVVAMCRIHLYYIMGFLLILICTHYHIATFTL